MATTQEIAQYITEQLGGAANGVALRKMFGEYGLWRNGKFFALICDSTLFFKETAAARELLSARGELIEAPAYDGAKDSFRIDNLDDAAFLRELLDATLRELPELRPKKPKRKA